jgi:Asp-tRNA(Asn)/Glu-tRNA(Gln) amidotransferase A subunit family amidase
MGGIAEFESLDALGLAELVTRGEATPSDLLEESLRRAKERNPKLNAIVIDMEEQARAAVETGLPDGPFKGVPFLVKDIGSCYSGVRTTSGCRFFEDNVADHDSDLIARYKNAGLTIFGKSASPEFGLTTSTESALFGTTRNPWNLEHTSGGSSGGSASAVAAGIVPIADGSDGGGSIRIPASCCGLVGLKASRGRISHAPDTGEGWSGMSTAGCLSRTVRDTAAMLDVTAGEVKGDPYYAPAADGPFLDAIGKDPGALRIAVHTKTSNGVDTHADCAVAVANAAKLCASLGHEVVEAPLSIDETLLRRSTRVIIGANIRQVLDARAATLGRRLSEDDIEPLTYAVYKNAERYAAADYVTALHGIHALGRSVEAFFADYDVVLSPTMAAPPQKVGGALRLNHPDGKEFAAAIALTIGFTQLFNATGNPAISLPLHWNEDGLPIGVQFAATYGGEKTLLGLAAQLEKAQPWADKRPA